MVYNETFISAATTVSQLIYALTTYVPKEATIVMNTSCETQPAVEIWYDKETNTVILK